jgi:hypothetical protein
VMMVQRILLMLLIIDHAVLSLSYSFIQKAFSQKSFINSQRTILRGQNIYGLNTLNISKSLISSMMSSGSVNDNESGDKAQKRLKVLCLHGYLSNAKYFRLQLRRLVDDASDTTDFVFLDGPHRFGLQKKQQKLEDSSDSSSGGAGAGAVAAGTAMLASATVIAAATTTSTTTTTTTTTTAAVTTATTTTAFAITTTTTATTTTTTSTTITTTNTTTTTTIIACLQLLQVDVEQIVNLTLLTLS